MRKRLFFLLLLMACFAGTWADELSEKQAQELAKSFVNSHFGRKGGSDLKSQGQVKGLGFYVFNMTEKGGFVIVSNESRSRPIIGFSETGKFDADNMPDNMRAWLQGYADEIAWLKKQPVVETATVTKNSKTRAGSHVTTEIKPLVKTQWNQRAPYNNLCPEYISGERSVTGCVATAMAQVMKYHNHPSAPTKVIPEYQTDSYHLQLSNLPITTFDWKNMSDTYTGKETDATATAVATLMQYCGYSVKMDYGPSSGSNSINVATALKEYFDYKSTTQFVSRSSYTYDKWVDLIYYELANKRPVVYGGQSSGGGHEFVCDGYKYENGTDYFHINWGWGGQSDDYYVLSVLNPYEGQGAGGSSSNDGFQFGQDAVIGIQPSTGTGTMSGITPNVINFKVNSITLSKSQITIGESVNVTFNVTNNSSDVYDGELTLIINNAVGDGKMFVIPANTTQDCVINFTPSGAGSYIIKCGYPNASGSYSFNHTPNATLTVLDYFPKNLTASSITSASAVLSWTQEVEVTSWVVDYKASNETEFTRLSNIGTNPYTLTGLLPETQYNVKVGSVVGNLIKWSSTITFTTDAIYAVPKNVTVSDITPTSARISWTGNANSYNMQYAVAPEGSNSNPKWLKYDNGTYETNFYFNNLTEYTWGVMYPGEMVDGNVLTKVEFYENSNNSQNITVNIYSGGDTAPGTLLKTMVVTPVMNGFHTVTLSSPLEITSGANLWITLTEAGEYPIICCETSPIVLNNQWIFFNDNWHIANNLFAGGFEYGWMIRGYIESQNNNEIQWTSTSCSSNSYELNGLSPETDYMFKLQAVYNGGMSKWSESTSFTTTSGIVLGDTENNTSVVSEASTTTETNVILTNRTLYKDGKWNTICLPFDVSDGNANDNITFSGTPLAGATVMELDVNGNYTNPTGLASDGTLYLNFKDVTKIVAGTPYIIKWANDTQQPTIDSPYFEGVNIVKTMNDVEFTGGKFVGTYKCLTFQEDDTTILFIGLNSKGESTLYYPKSGATIGAQRAYFDLSVNPSGVRGFSLNFGNDDTKTGIISLTNDSGNQGEVWYDLSGRKLSGKPERKGVYVQNGKKVVIK